MAKINPEMLLEFAAVAIMERTRSTTKAWVICYKDGFVKCLPAKRFIDDGNVFGNFREGDLENGLSAEQWDNLSKRMSTFFEGLNLCPKHLKL